MVLGALLTFCICKRRKQNRRRKGKTPPPLYSEIPGNVSLLESAKGRKSQKGNVGARGYGRLCYGLRLISEGQSSGVTTEDL